MDKNLISEQRVQPPSDKTPKRSSRTLQLSYIPPSSHSGIPPTMANSPTTTRRRATLTPHQAWRHATGSFFPPEPHVHEEWIYCGEETIPEVDSSSDSSTASKGTTSPDPDTSSLCTPLSEAYSLSTTSYTIPQSECRPRSGSHTGVHYSTAHRRVPSSPSFRSTLTLAPQSSYFDRPTSPASSISSRCSEPLMNASLSLSELLTSTTNTPFGELHVDGVDGFARREIQREERKQAMRERHAAICERRVRERTKSQTRC